MASPSNPDYTWAALDRPALGAMSATTKLNDVAVDDSTTGETSTDGNAPPSTDTLIAPLTAVVDFGEAVILAAWRYTGDNNRTTQGQPFTDAFFSFSVIGAIEYSTDGLSWTSADSRSLAVSTSPFTTNGTFAGSPAARYVRCVVIFSITALGIVPMSLASVYLSDLRITASAVPVSPCNPPNAEVDLPRGTRRSFVNTGTVAPDVDPWEIWRCTTLYDSGVLGSYGLDGWLVDNSGTASGGDYDVYAPPFAAIQQGYQARIRNRPTPLAGLFHSFEFNVVASGTAGDRGMAEAQRPRVFEDWAFGRENLAGTAVTPNRRSQMLMMAPPNPVQPGQQVTAPGNRAPTAIIPQKGHTEAAINGPMGFVDNIYTCSSLLGQPLRISTPIGATQTRDVIFMWKTAQDDVFDTWTVESGTTDFPARFSYANINSATFNIGKTENMFDGNVVGRLLDEGISAYAGTAPTLVPLVPMAAKDNSHSIAPTVAGLGTASAICDVQTMQHTFGTRREMHFTQCPVDSSFGVMMPVAEAGLLTTLQLSLRSTARQYLAYLRSRSPLLYYKFFNQGPLIEPGFNYEFELIEPFEFDSRATGEQDGATTGTYTLKPLYDPTFDPYSIGTAGGYGAIRIRAPFTALPSATNI